MKNARLFMTLAVSITQTQQLFCCCGEMMVTFFFVVLQNCKCFQEYLGIYKRFLLTYVNLSFLSNQFHFYGKKAGFFSKSGGSLLTFQFPNRKFSILDHLFELE